MTLSHSTYTGYGGGGGSGGVFAYEASTVNYDDSMIINVGGGARGEGECPYSPSYCNQNPFNVGFAGSVGKVFLVSKFSFFFLCLIVVRMFLKSPHFHSHHHLLLLTII